MIEYRGIHHVSLAVTNLEKSKNFYGDILGFQEIVRPNFGFPGAWYQIGHQQVHLIQYEDAQTIRQSDELNSREGHLAIRVKDYDQALAYLKEKGVKIKENPRSKSGFAQIFCMDPDRNLIEMNVNQAQLK
ncbi:VOC family protein [Bacillus weihaiensis]|uniref:Glyoxalase n=1 Tax=Bacillus weihaiensis TaxID=1547283 RepID=A0A1L3MTM9_9BACI|nr:VOC family protein [Bacillus weihaiensis]APH05697.1 glyoxalase [Bacillus weihaiensis]